MQPLTSNNDTLDVTKSDAIRSPHTALDTNDQLELLRSNVIGDNVAFATPFGTRPNVYADFTASGRSLQCIEDTIQRHVLPFYANTHTTTSVTGLTSTTLREDARRTIAASVNAHPDKDSVIFTGSGATAAIQKFVHAMGLG
ncbi:hypothetical protein As57867_011435, partial [Aphanomyces stellatus]